MDFPVVMGILNVTPDSFSDGGDFFDPEAAIRHGLEMAAQGAGIIDVGGESTRPGADEIGVREQLDRVLPVIKALASRLDIPISVDTRSAEVAAKAIEAGAAMVNDVSGFLHDPEMPAVLGKYRPLAVAMHMRGTPQNMRELTDYRSILWDVANELMTGVQKAVDKGLPFNNVWLDPGIGFAKNAEQSLFLLANLKFFKYLGRPLVVGPSRKSFLQPLVNKPPEGREWATAAAVAWAVANGADCVRVHAAGPMMDVVNTIRALKEAGVE